MIATHKSMLAFLLAAALAFGSASAAGQEAEALRPALPPELEPHLREFTRTLGKRWTFGYTPDGKQIASIIGLPKTPLPADSAADTIFKRSAAIRQLHITAFDAGSKVETPSTVTYRWNQTIDGTRIENAYIVIQLDRASGLFNASVQTVTPAVPPLVLSAKDAREIAIAELKRELERAAALAGAKSLFDEPVAEQPFVTAVESDDTLLSVDDRVFRVYPVAVRVWHAMGGEEWTLIHRRYDIDASRARGEGGHVVRVQELQPRARDVPSRVFDPNPVAALNLPTLRASDVDDQSSAYVDVKLCDLLETGGKILLDGRYVRLIDRYLPGTPQSPPPTADVAAAATAFLFRRGSADFAATSAYFHLDRLQRHVEALGLAEYLPLPILVDAEYGRAESAMWAHYTPQHATILFGNRNGVFLAEDADAIVHEHGHAVLMHTTGDRFLTLSTSDGRASEAAAIAEGFADYWAYSASHDVLVKSKFDLDCFAEWAWHNGCYRTYTKRPSHKLFCGSAGPHTNGEIWSGTLVDIFQRLDDRATADWLFVKGHHNAAYEGDTPSMNAIADGIVLADQQGFEGKHKAMLCTAFGDHDIGPLKCCAPAGCLATRTGPTPPSPAFATK